MVNNESFNKLRRHSKKVAAALALTAIAGCAKGVSATQPAEKPNVPVSIAPKVVTSPAEVAGATPVAPPSASGTEAPTRGDVPASIEGAQGLAVSPTKSETAEAVVMGRAMLELRAAGHNEVSDGQFRSGIESGYIRIYKDNPDGTRTLISYKVVNEDVLPANTPLQFSVGSDLALNGS